uniref:Uncharacterized protein n=1 Tax=Cajanus cajan TaxID=3821 RepID=A0A151R048_CAJCA|nr:hypothetical protein KK1_043082 [Cajanus cajan]
MDSLIDNAEDVKELRLSGVFRNLLGSDENLANLFNELGVDLPTKWKTWLAEAYNTHFSTPWTIIAFFAALQILILTFIQTLFTIHPR